MINLEQMILEAVTEAIGPAREQVLLHRPYFPPTAWQYVKECLDTGWVSSAGSYVTKFEQLLAQTTGCKRAVATVNGTAALEICLRLVGVKAGEEVICPSLSFIATANAISHCSAMPHFVDVSLDRLSICPQALEKRLNEIGRLGNGGTFNHVTGRRIAAVCLMHCFGHPGELEPILEICDRYSIPLIEDAAESLGSYYKAKHTGRFGKLSAVSFNGNKILTTGGGGAILTDDEKLADHAKHLTTTAKVPHPWEFHHDEIAWNYRLPNINAALGVAQLEILPELLRAKRAISERYMNAFEKIPGVNFLREPKDSQSNYWLNGIAIENSDKSQLGSLLKTLNAAGYQCRPIWEPAHQLPMYKECPRGPLYNTESLKVRVINIPSSADLAQGWQVDR
ncbi:MAG TPA: LegC family aminotransferase [Pirellula sp.]|nr:LegC family aminotransferase [Pirellula sp.]